MEGKKAERRSLEAQLALLEMRLQDLRERLPAHSIPPAMMLELDALEEEIEEVRTRLEELGDEDGDQ